MNMLKQAILLWKQEKSGKGTSLQRRLLLFFIAATLFILLSFAALLLVFGITGSGRTAVKNYMDSELSHLHTAVADHSGRLSVQGVAFSEQLSLSADAFFKENGVKAKALPEHPELLEPLLAGQMRLVQSIMERNVCSGAFILLDATVKPEAENAATQKSGVFIKMTQHNTKQAVGAKQYYLRGPAQIARDNGMELLGQWTMEYDISGEAFFAEVMETARLNPDKPLSRLYYWTGRVALKANSEAGFLLCVPLRSADGTVFGVCGVEVSDRLFKQLYTPGENDYDNVFTLASPCAGDTFYTSDCLIAGNYYQTGTRMEYDLSAVSGDKGFAGYRAEQANYGGLHASLRLYPSGSAYEQEKWAVAVMMPEAGLKQAVAGSSPYLLAIVLALLVISLSVSVFISRRYLRPVTEALDRIKAKDYTKQAKSPYLEINDLMEFLAQQDEEMRSRAAAISEPDEDTVPMFEQFLEHVKTLSPAERSVFDLYLRGYKAQQIADELHLSINTIKTHNRRIFSKLDVSNRKELLVYIDMMKEMNLIKKGVNPWSLYYRNGSA